MAREDVGENLLRRELGVVLGSLVVINATIGTGIFKTPARVARLAGTLPASLAVWAIGGVIAVCGALTLAELCAAIERGFGQLDVVVHIAGGFRMGDVHETSESDWNFLMDLNARSAFNLAHGVVPIMKRQGSGAIIHIGARAALKSDAHVGVYAASKAALLRLSESMAAELLDSGIRVNCVLPSTIDTEANRKAMPAADPKKWVAPESIAEVILFLCSPAARDISGAQIPVYGRS